MKITIELDETRERQLQHLSQTQKQDMTEIVQRMVEEYLDEETIPSDSDEMWGEVAIQLAHEIYRDEPPWEDDENGGRFS